MKKLIAMLLMLVMACGMLVSCDEDRVFGSYLPNYDDYEPEVQEKITLNLYIITDDTTAQNAMDTVALNINLFTTRNYNTELKVHYLSEAKYQSKVTEKVSATDEDAANIILINNVALFTSLQNAGKLVDMTPYLATDEFGMLNVNVAPALLESAKVGDKVYAIPNNHVIGEYEYLVIDKWANNEFKIIPPSMFDNDLGPAELEGLDTLVADLREKLAENGYDPDEYIYKTHGPYELQEELEADGKLECLAVKNPVATPKTALSSAFAIINRGSAANERAMQIIYEINMNPEFRNLLQYGVLDINYKLNDGKVEMIKSNTTTYSMNLLYTGNVFNAYYCEEIGWTETVANNGKLQNKEAVSE